MTRWQKARWKLRTRNFRWAVRGAYGSITFPVRHPIFWLMCRYSSIFFGLYHGGRPDLAMRFGKIWPKYFETVTRILRDKGERLPVLFP